MVFNSTIQIFEGDRVIVKPLYKYGVPTVQEVKLLFDYFEDFSDVKIALALIAIEALRPAEVPHLVWNRFKITDEGIKEIRHLVYKPTNHKTKTGNNFYFKEVIKPVYSKWLSDQIIGYAKQCPVFVKNKVFSWNTTDMLMKHIIRLRQKVKNGEVGSEYNFLLDTTDEVVVGASMNRYRVNPYSLRRFAFTIHYYLTFKQDAVTLSKAFGHSRVDTTLTHYVQPKESIGLTDEMIQKQISVDEFIQMSGKKQKQILEWLPDWKKRFVPAGQSTLNEF